MTGTNRDQSDRVRLALDSVLKDLIIGLKQQAFIPPGGGYFTFANPRFTSVGDLMLDVIYRAP